MAVSIEGKKEEAHIYRSVTSYRMDRLNSKDHRDDTSTSFVCVEASLNR